MDDTDWMSWETFLLTTSNVVGGLFYLVSRSREKVIRNLQVNANFSVFVFLVMRQECWLVHSLQTQCTMYASNNRILLIFSD